MDPQPHQKRFRRQEFRHELRFITFSCHDRLPLFRNERIRDRFTETLEEMRLRHRFILHAWVIMPEHIHMVIAPLLPQFPATAMLSDLKRTFARQILQRWRVLRAPILSRLRVDSRQRFWQRGGGFDRNLRPGRLRRTIRYIHNNPVKRGLVLRPVDWKWSSYCWYLGDHTGPKIEPVSQVLLD